MRHISILSGKIQSHFIFTAGGAHSCHWALKMLRQFQSFFICPMDSRSVSLICYVHRAIILIFFHRLGFKAVLSLSRV